MPPPLTIADATAGMQFIDATARDIVTRFVSMLSGEPAVREESVTRHCITYDRTFRNGAARVRIYDYLPTGAFLLSRREKMYASLTHPSTQWRHARLRSQRARSPPARYSRRSPLGAVNPLRVVP